MPILTLSSLAGNDAVTRETAAAHAAQDPDDVRNEPCRRRSRKTTTASSSAPATTAWCSARYLAKCGLDILLVDRRLQYGGGLSTQEVTAPGFYHNLHSINHFHISETPWFKDLNLADRVTYITPRYELGQPHLDGTALVFGRDLEETLANVARFSKKDAQTFRDWNRKAEEITRRIFLPERYRRAAAAGRARGAAVARARSAAIFSR